MRPARVRVSLGYDAQGAPAHRTSRSVLAGRPERVRGGRATVAVSREPLSAARVPTTRSSSASAASGSSTLIVVMPSARAVFRLLPMSSRNTASAGSTSELAADELVDARVGLAQPDRDRLDEHVEERAQRARALRPR